MFDIRRKQRITGPYDEALAAVCHNGTFVDLEENGVVTYKGIPYAQPPVGTLRWKPPVLAGENQGVYEAYYYGHAPLQSEWPSEVGSYYPQSEDCLTLNVWTNPAGPTSGKAVMVFLHGGSYGWGTTSDPMYEGHNLVAKYPDLVLVTVEYRVGLMGFIDFSSVPGGEAFAESGNLGLLDQVCALQLINRNIAAFGGDPDNVTVFGESAGVCGAPRIFDSSRAIPAIQAGITLPKAKLPWQRVPAAADPRGGRPAPTRDRRERLRRADLQPTGVRKADATAAGGEWL